MIMPVFVHGSRKRRTRERGEKNSGTTAGHYNTETEEDTETAADRQEEEKSQGQGLSGLDAENRTSRWQMKITTRGCMSLAPPMKHIKDIPLY